MIIMCLCVFSRLVVSDSLGPNCVYVYIYIYRHTSGEIIITIKLINIVIYSQLAFYFVVRTPEITLSANF